jgi:phosphatidylserine/phosphatidylglycerophosphate/cardiolipin synthase-like enzyme
VIDRQRPRTSWPLELDFGGEAVRVWPAFSPAGLVPEEELLELPRMLEWISEARERVSVQVLTYRTAGYGGEYFGELEDALRAAAARGVEVRLLVADWGKRRGTIEGLKSLQLIPGIEVLMVTIPPASGGHIPFARVVHSKCLLVDGARAWVGSSNWEGSYFYKGRNVGLFVEGSAFGAALERRFSATWSSEYAAAVDPCVDYEVPRIGD